LNDTILAIVLPARIQERYCKLNKEERFLFSFFFLFFIFFNFQMLGGLALLDQIVRDKQKFVKAGNFHPNKIFPQKKTHTSKFSHRLPAKRFS